MSKVINVVLIIAIVLILVLGFLLTIGAESNKPNVNRTDRPPERTGVNISGEDIPRLVEIIRIWKLVDELGLEEKQLMVFLPRFKQLNELRAQYYRSRHESLAELRKMLDKNSPEDQIKSLIGEIKKTELEFRQNEQQLAESLESVLTVQQQAKFTVFQDTYNRDMSRLIRSLKELSELRGNQTRYQPSPPLTETEERRNR